MKKIIIAIVLGFSFMPIAYSAEIAGTRVSGQNAVCAEGQRKGIEINVTTKEETSYCYIEDVVAETVTPAPTPSITPTPPNTDAPADNTDSSVDTGTTVTPTPTVTPMPTPTPTATLPTAPTAPPKSNVVIVDVSAGTTIIREETEEEWYERFLRMWSFFYEELTHWWLSINA